MENVSSTKAKISQPPSASRPSPVKTRPSQAMKLSYQTQIETRQMSSKPTTSSGQKIDIRV